MLTNDQQFFRKMLDLHGFMMKYPRDPKGYITVIITDFPAFGLLASCKCANWLYPKATARGKPQPSSIVYQLLQFEESALENTHEIKLAQGNRTMQVEHAHGV